MEPATSIRDPDAKLKSFPFTNGAAKKPHLTPPPHDADEVLYRECLKNHAASLGGHALDGCGEFMPSLSANPDDPTSFKCAACGCHRNFHRRIAGLNLASGAPACGEDCLEGEGERDDDREDYDMEDARPRSPSPPPSSYFNSAPHMLLALSSGQPLMTSASMVAKTQLKKRSRTKFSPLQKEMMLELSEKLGWRLQKRDEEIVEKYCAEIGIGKAIFKVWMHNNKQHLFGQSLPRMGEAINGASPSGAASMASAGAAKIQIEGNINVMNGED